MPVTNYLPSSRLIQPGVCTSTTRPVTPFEGQAIYETDTDTIRTYNGSAWIPTAGRVPSCKVRITADTAGYANNAVITFTSEVIDTDSMFNPSDTKITINTSGIYILMFYGAVVGAAGGTITAVSPSITTPSDTLVCNYSSNQGATDWRWSIASTDYLTAGTQIRAQVFFAGASSATLGGTNGYQQCRLSVHYVGQQ